MSRALLGAVEIGGTHARAGLVDLAGPPPLMPASRAERRFDPAADRDTLLSAILGVARDAAGEPDAQRRWGVAVPAPFDYATGRCTIHGQHKLDALNGVDLRAELAGALHLADPGAVRFGNDADAFLLGEWAAGAARGASRAVGVTLGTGLGSAFLADGMIVTEDPAPAGGELYPLHYRGRPVEDVVSVRGLRVASGMPDADGRRLATAAREGNRRCRVAFAELGTALGVVLAPWLIRFEPSHLVVGGGLAGAWDLIEPAFRAVCAPVATLSVRLAERPGEGPLIGAAVAAVGWRAG